MKYLLSLNSCGGFLLNCIGLWISHEAVCFDAFLKDDAELVYHLLPVISTGALARLLCKF